MIVLHHCRQPSASSSPIMALRITLIHAVQSPLPYSSGATVLAHLHGKIDEHAAHRTPWCSSDLDLGPAPELSVPSLSPSPSLDSSTANPWHPICYCGGATWFLQGHASLWGMSGLSVAISSSRVTLLGYGPARQRRTS